MKCVVSAGVCLGSMMGFWVCVVYHMGFGHWDFDFRLGIGRDFEVLLFQSLFHTPLFADCELLVTFSRLSGF